MSNHRDTKADQKIRSCLDKNQSFAVIAGAGSGKTTSLVDALKYIRETKGKQLRQADRNVVCVTYTNRAVDVISQRLEWDELFRVSTIHNFLWDSIKRFNHDIREALQSSIILEQIAKKQKDDNSGNSNKATAARKKIEDLQSDMEALKDVTQFKYNDSTFSHYPTGLIGHDDIIKISTYLIQNKANLRSILSQKYPYIFVDEAQDTFPVVVEALNSLSGSGSQSLVGYFGDPMQQIYDKRAGNFVESDELVRITKEENFRCSPEVIKLLNNFRKDVNQFAAGNNAEITGSVRLFLIQAEKPEAPRRRYSERQTIQALEKYEEVLKQLGWSNQDDIKHLFLVRQMIARRLGFSALHNLFTSRFSLTRSQETYESGEHYLLKPFVECLSDLIRAQRNGQASEVLQILRKYSPQFHPQGSNATKTISYIQALSAKLIKGLDEIWDKVPIEKIIIFCRDYGLFNFSERLLKDLNRKPRAEPFDQEQNSEEKSDWLADVFLKMHTKEIDLYVNFIKDNTAYSTQHGVKGEEYQRVVTVFDDTEAAWNNYSFTKTLTPKTSGTATEGQYDRTTKLAYVCFSRAEVDLCVVLFTQNPEIAKNEVINNSLFSEEQITIWN